MSSKPSELTVPQQSRVVTMRQFGARTCFCAVALTIFSACDGSQTQQAGDTTTNGKPLLVTDSLRPAIGTGWEAAAGAFLILPTVEGGHDAGSLLRPDANDSTVGDTTGLPAKKDSDRLELFSRAGLVGEAKFTIEKGAAVDSGCTAWPIARLNAQTGTAPRGWTAAFVKGHITQVPLDSIEGLAPRDSASLAANISRLASGLSDDTVATFRGLRFVVLRAYRAKSGDKSFVVATLVRRVNQEDAPREERLVMVIDGEQASPDLWTVGWHERAAGREDELVVSEPLMAFQLQSGGRTHLLFGRDDGEALSAALLVRDAKGWRVLWESALAGCEH